MILEQEFIVVREESFRPIPVCLWRILQEYSHSRTLQQDIGGCCANVYPFRFLFLTLCSAGI